MLTFHPFPRLPLELRLAIWEMTVEPREVEVRIVQPTPENELEALCCMHPDRWFWANLARFEDAVSHVQTSTRAGRKARRKPRLEGKPYHPYVHMVSSTIPATLHSCREARNHGLYQKVSMDVDEQHTDRRYVWLNMDIDLLNIGDTYLIYFLPIASSIKRLKLNRLYHDRWEIDNEKDYLPKFCNVEELHVVCIDGFEGWGDGVKGRARSKMWSSLLKIQCGPYLEAN